MKAVFLDYGTMGPDLDLTALEALFTDLTLFDDTDNEEVAERIAGAGFVLTNKFPMTDAVLANAGQLRYIGLTATGTDNIDLARAKELDIAVSNIRAYCTQSVVEHVFGTLLTLAHSLHRYNAAVAAGDWQRSRGFCLLNHPIRELSSMTLGIVGFGELGRGVARLAEAFGMQVIVSARPGTNEVPADRVSFDELLAQADAVSLHCPLNDTTRNLFSKPQFDAMKKDAILINTARGGLVDSAALVQALSSGEIAAAGIDVLPFEPPVRGDPLLDYDGNNLLVTPHIAWATTTARQNAIDELTANIRAFLAGEERNRVA